MTELQDKSVHLVITSPPYWQLKDYEAQNQIGYNDSYEEYINNWFISQLVVGKSLYDLQ